MSMFTRVLRMSLVLAGVLLMSTSLDARKRTHWGEGFIIELDKPYDQVLSIVREVAEDGIIRGTSQYKGTQELEGAVSSKTSRAFPSWQEGGTILYKARPNTLSPDHFFESADKGTVVVRYVVQSAGSSLTRLRIDATFDEDSHHRTHPSDGSVESGEFEAISSKIKDLEDRETKRRQDMVAEQQEQKSSELQAELDHETAALNALTKREQELQNQLQAINQARTGRVRTASADLKAFPYNRAKTLRTLSQGDTVTVLLRTKAWYQVQAANGEQGWVYGLMLEVSQ
jgi:hypothetical protein